MRGDTGDRRCAPGATLQRVDAGVRTLIDEVGGLLLADVDVVTHPEGDAFEGDLAALALEESLDEMAQDCLFVELTARVVVGYRWHGYFWLVRVEEDRLLCSSPPSLDCRR